MLMVLLLLLLMLTLLLLLQLRMQTNTIRLVRMLHILRRLTQLELLVLLRLSFRVATDRDDGDLFLLLLLLFVRMLRRRWLRQRLLSIRTAANETLRLRTELGTVDGRILLLRQLLLMDIGRRRRCGESETLLTARRGGRVWRWRRLCVELQRRFERVQFRVLPINGRLLRRRFVQAVVVLLALLLTVTADNGTVRLFEHSELFFQRKIAQRMGVRCWLRLQWLWLRLRLRLLAIGTAAAGRCDQLAALVSSDNQLRCLRLRLRLLRGFFVRTKSAERVQRNRRCVR